MTDADVTAREVRGGQDAIRAAVEGRRPLSDRDSFLAPLFLLPAIVYILALVAVPFFLAIAFSPTAGTAGDPSLDWVGLDNFEAIFNDPIFWGSRQNPLLYPAITMAL